MTTDTVNSPNERLRQARLVLVSPSGSGRPLSRQELADLVNEHLTSSGLRHTFLDATYIGKLERGKHRWPQRAYRDAFRVVLGVQRDADLGFYIRRRQPDTTDTAAVMAAALVPTMAERRALTLWLAPSTNPARSTGDPTPEAVDA